MRTGLSRANPGARRQVHIVLVPLMLLMPLLMLLPKPLIMKAHHQKKCCIQQTDGGYNSMDRDSVNPASKAPPPPRERGFEFAEVAIHQV
jgi:hypothetical protein